MLHVGTQGGRTASCSTSTSRTSSLRDTTSSTPPEPMPFSLSQGTERALSRRISVPDSTNHLLFRRRDPRRIAPIGGIPPPCRAHEVRAAVRHGRVDDGFIPCSSSHFMDPCQATRACCRVQIAQCRGFPPSSPPPPIPSRSVAQAPCGGR